MTQKRYLLGSTIRLRAQFRVEGVLTDPTEVTFRVNPPTGNNEVLVYPADAEIVRDSEGIFHIDYQPNKVGIWYYRFEGTGAAAGVSESSLEITASCVVTTI